MALRKFHTTYYFFGGCGPKSFCRVNGLTSLFISQIRPTMGRRNLKAELYSSVMVRRPHNAGVIAHRNRSFGKRPSNPKNLCFSVDGKHFENGAFWKRCLHDVFSRFGSLKPLLLRLAIIPSSCPRAKGIHVFFSFVGGNNKPIATWFQLDPCCEHAHECTQAIIPLMIVAFSHFSGIVCTEKFVAFLDLKVRFQIPPV